MNKIFRKCRDFGLMVRLKDILLDDILSCVQGLVVGNIPLCVIDIKDNKNWKELLTEIAFKAELFIAAENISSLEEAYSAAGCGAQFFILGNCNRDLMTSLKDMGFYFIPRISNKGDLLLCEELLLECVITEDISLLDNSSIVNVLNNPSELSQMYNRKNIFSIIDLEKADDYELWINTIIKEYLGLNYTEITIREDISEELKDFADLFNATNKCKTSISNENSLLLECNDFTRTVNYLKWKAIYINPNDTVIVDGRVVKSFLDKQLNGFKVILVERNRI